MRRVTGGVQIFIGMNSREAVAGMPLVTGLGLIGFTTRLGLEPEEFSGRDVLPILEDVDQSQLIMLTFFPSSSCPALFLRSGLKRERGKAGVRPDVRSLEPR